MNAKIRRKLARRKRRIEKRLDKSNTRGCERPVLTAANIQYEIADRTRGIRIVRRDTKCGRSRGPSRRA